MIKIGKRMENRGARARPSLYQLFPERPVRLLREGSCRNSEPAPTSADQTARAGQRIPDISLRMKSFLKRPGEEHWHSAAPGAFMAPGNASERRRPLRDHDMGTTHHRRQLHRIASAA